MCGIGYNASLAGRTLCSSVCPSDMMDVKGSDVERSDDSGDMLFPIGSHGFELRLWSFGFVVVYCCWNFVDV